MELKRKKKNLAKIIPFIFYDFFHFSIGMPKTYTKVITS